MNVSRNGAIALSWKDPIVISPLALALAPPLLAAGLSEPPQAASQLVPNRPAAPTAPRPIA
jgi:hypothetical protein